VADAATRASVGTLTAVIPHYAYARQDRKADSREPITSRLVANLLETAGFDRIITLDLHQGQIQGFFDIPVTHLTALYLLGDYFMAKDFDWKNTVVVSPDMGRAKAAKKLSLNASAVQLKVIARAMSETDPKAAPVIKKEHKASSSDIERLTEVYNISESLLADYGYTPKAKGTYLEYESDSDLREAEKIPVKEDIYTYFQREVRPYVADAWINLPQTKIGCEISFNKYFYKPAPLRTLEENERDIRALDAQSQGFIQALFENL
jgi:hypothetical protein